MNKTTEMQKRLEKAGYTTSPKIAKVTAIFENSVKRAGRELPVMFLTGAPGSGKTMLAETFGKIVDANIEFIQCYPGMDSSAFIAEPNLSAIIKQDAANAVSDGILVRCLKNSCRNLNPTVLIIDELDKADSSIDSFLLDFCNSGRVTNGQQEWRRGDGYIYVFITSNEERDISDALLNRCRHVDIPRPDIDTLMSICGLEKDHYLRRVFMSCPDFSIRQAKSYLRDLEDLGELFDEDVLSQYVDIQQIRAFSISEMESIYGAIPDGALEPVSEVLKIKNSSKWGKFMTTSFEEGEYELVLDEEEELCVKFNTLSALKSLIDADMYPYYYENTFKVKVDDWSILGLDQAVNHSVVSDSMVVGIFINPSPKNVYGDSIIKYYQQITEGSVGPTVVEVSVEHFMKYYQD